MMMMMMMQTSRNSTRYVQYSKGRVYSVSSALQLYINLLATVQ